MKLDFSVRYVRSLLWSNVLEFDTLCSFILSINKLSNLPLSKAKIFFPDVLLKNKFGGIFKMSVILTIISVYGLSD